MPYDLSRFLSCLPSHRYRFVVDAATDEALHAAFWPRSSFSSFDDFVQFTYRYSCVIQPYLSNPDRDDLDEWFRPEPTSDHRAAELLQNYASERGTAQSWLAQYYPAFSIDWPCAEQNGSILTIADAEWPEMLGANGDGYFCAFVADAT